MRKTFTPLIIALICLAQISNAQISKGSTFLGGSVYASGSSSKNDTLPTNKNSNNSFGISPQFGKAIGTNAIFGVFLNYNRNSSEQTFNSTTYKNTTTSYGAGVFYRRYYQFANRFYLFGEGSFGLSYGDYENVSNAITYGKSKPLTVDIGITPGLSFAASKKLFIESSLNRILSLYYRHYKSYVYNSFGVQTGTATNNDYGFAANGSPLSNLSIGLRWILPSKK